MIGDEESGGRECARIARPLSHQLLNLHPFSGRGGAKRRSAVGRWTGVVFRCLRSRGFERAEGFTYHQEKWPAAQCDVYVISTGGHYHELWSERLDIFSPKTKVRSANRILMVHLVGCPGSFAAALNFRDGRFSPTSVSPTIVSGGLSVIYWYRGT